MVKTYWVLSILVYHTLANTEFKWGTWWTNKIYEYDDDHGDDGDYEDDDKKDGQRKFGAFAMPCANFSQTSNKGFKNVLPVVICAFSFGIL